MMIVMPMGWLVPRKRSSQVVLRQWRVVLVVVWREVSKADVDVGQQSPQSVLPVLSTLLPRAVAATVGAVVLLLLLLLLLVGIVWESVGMMLLLLLTIRVGPTQRPGGEGGPKAHGAGETSGVVQMVEGGVCSVQVVTIVARRGGGGGDDIVTHA